MRGRGCAIGRRIRVRPVSEVDPRLSGLALPADDVVVARLRARDEEMFGAVLAAWSPGMLQVARAYVADEHAAEDVVQEAWLGVLRGIETFEARSSLRTWIYQIVINRAKTRGVRDARVVPMTSLTPLAEDFDATVDPARFRGPGDPYPRHWRDAPSAWPTPETDLLTKEIYQQLDRAIEALPARQRIVITLRDIAGYSGDEVCDFLDITPANQRVLLHRARAAIRAALDGYLRTRTAS
jgi:RNA polymerase sigma-70 factor (ECF subfamily)